MVEPYNLLKDQLFSVVEGIENCVDRLYYAGIATENEKNEWSSYLKFARDTFSSAQFRIAVVGSVKSGKSTLINTLLGDDLLKRGAGIVTAFVTRIISDDRKEAIIELKRPDQISNEVKRLIGGLLSGASCVISDLSDFNIDREEHRKIIMDVLDELREADLSHGSRRNLLLLRAYLEGYESLKGLLGETTVLKFEGSDIIRHRDFVGRESHAVYVRNVELHYPGSWIGKGVEIADCQGSDAPNPLHYALLQEYLYTAHTIIYVISSRIGLREADFKLLDFIRSLSMMKNTIFVLNVDLDVHPSFEDLASLRERVQKELSLFDGGPQIYAFSALAELIGQPEGLRSDSEARRLTLWKETAPDLLENSRTQFSLFKEELDRVIGRARATTIGAAVTRTRLVGSTVLDFVRTRKSLLDENFSEKKQIISEIEKRQYDVISAMSMLESMISGLRDSLIAECDKAIQKFFDLKYGPVVSDTLKMIEGYRLEPGFEARLRDVKGLITTLYDFYMHFRNDLARFIVEDVNVRIMAFAREQEEFLRRRLKEAATGFWALLKVPLDDYRRALHRLGTNLTAETDMTLDHWNPVWELSPPNFGLLADDYVLTKGVLYAKYSLGRISRFWKRLARFLRVRKADRESLFGEDNLLEAISVVKRQAKDEILYAFRDYRQNFRFGYVRQLIDDGIASLLKEFTVRVDTVKINLERLRELQEEERKKQHSFGSVLNEVEQTLSGLLHRLDALQLMCDSPGPEADRVCARALASSPEAER